MSLAIVYSRARQGIHASLVTVEVHISNGLPSLSIVGLPETAVKESKDRVRSALLTSHFEFPARRITINLAPADLPKEGGQFDLAIALGILAASDQVNKDSLREYECIGELSLGGSLRPVKGALLASLKTRDADRALILPDQNADEASLVNQSVVFAANHLLEVCAHINKQKPIIRHTSAKPKQQIYQGKCFQDVHGHFHVKRALEIAATGMHNLIMVGSPGTGKSMLAERMPTILPPLNEDQALESASIASISKNGLNLDQWKHPPFRAPHHSASAVALVGGGSNPGPGEISLAHNGTLFLDELPEFDRKALEVLREPMETGSITISRANHQTDFPARFQLIAAMNPCYCGYLGDVSGRCNCTSEQVQRHRNRISGPLFDRIDMHIDVPRVSHEILRNGAPQGEETSAQIKQRVIKARNRALQRCGQSNASLTAPQVKKYCQPGDTGHKLIEQAMDRFGLSHRAYHRILKTSRTIADLDDSKSIKLNHVSEAIGYRKLDRRV